MSYHTKALFREELNIKGFCKDFGVGRGCTFFFTLTFRDNVKDKKEAVKRWNIIRTSISKKFKIFHYICVWERQKRGAWHLHLIGSIPSMGSMNSFRTFLNEIISRSNTNTGFFRVIWTYGNSQTIGNYMSKYLTKEDREPFVRYVNYTRNFSRCCGSEFMFVGGGAGRWRSACRVLDGMFPDTFKFYFRHADFDGLLRVVNGCQGNIQTFVLGLQDMLKFYYDSDHYIYRRQFAKQVHQYGYKYATARENTLLDGWF
jgi:hypothetical protein